LRTFSVHGKKKKGEGRTKQAQTDGNSKIKETSGLGKGAKKTNVDRKLDPRPKSRGRFSAEGVEGAERINRPRGPKKVGPRGRRRPSQYGAKTEKSGRVHVNLGPRSDPKRERIPRGKRIARSSHPVEVTVKKFVMEELKRNVPEETWTGSWRQ